MFSEHVIWKAPLTTPGQLPEAKEGVKRLVVLVAFDKDEETGELLPAFEAREMPDERRAVMAAKEMSRRHAGVITWSREADLKLGEYGWSEFLFSRGRYQTSTEGFCEQSLTTFPIRTTIRTWMLLCNLDSFFQPRRA